MKTAKKYLNTSFQKGFQTKAIRSGFVPGNDLSHSEPIFATSAYHYEDATHAARLYAKEEKGNVYSRIHNPTTEIFENRIAALENAEAALAVASGMAAITQTFLQILKNGNHVICAKEVYGGTNQLLKVTLAKFGIETTFVNSSNSREFENAIKPNTKVIFFETPTNPTLSIVNIKAISDIAKKHNILTIVDNTVATPALQNPINLGVDIVIHSATKYIDGQGRTIGGVVCGKKDFIEQLRNETLRNTGSCLSPFHSWVFIKGLETLSLRVERHSQNALKIAEFLEDHPSVKKVNYPFLKSHPNYYLAKKQQKFGGGLLSFEVSDLESGRNIINSVELISLVGNLGDTKTIIGHPASTSHHQLTEKELLESGISPGLIRLSVGLEDTDDLISDLNQALNKLQKPKISINKDIFSPNNESLISKSFSAQN